MRQALITEAIDEGGLHRLIGNTRPQATAANDFHREHVILQLKRSPDEAQALQGCIDSLHDPVSRIFTDA
jgi:hypothetical protein